MDDLQLLVVGVDGDDALGAHQPRARDRGIAHTAAADHRGRAREAGLEQQLQPVHALAEARVVGADEHPDRAVRVAFGMGVVGAHRLTVAELR